MRIKDAYIIWTTYFDINLPRSRGRKVSKNEAVSNPTLDELRRAAEKAGYKVLGIKKAKYPAIWWMEGTGYIVIEKNNRSKYEALKKIARELRRLRGGK